MSNPDLRQTGRGQATVFSALGDTTRLELVAKLCDGGSRSIVQLADDFPLTRQAITKHLRVLELAGIVRMNRIGRESHYAYIAEPIAEASSYLNQVSQQCQSSSLRP